MITLVYPRIQSVAFSNTLFKLYDQAVNADCEEVIFDLSRSESITPFGIIMLTATITECFRKKMTCTYKRPADNKLQRFLREIGFHKYFGVRDEDCKEISNIQTGNVQLRKLIGLNTMIIETLTEILDYHLYISPGVKGSLRMSLQEAITNVIDHSKTNEYYICCWKYPSKKQIRLCIADLGIGIKASLMTSPKYRDIKNDHEAIKLATEEGVSSRESQAGLGLSHIKKFLSVNEGQLCIISGHGKIFWKYDHGKILKQSMVQKFDGTIIKLIVNTSKDGFYFMSDEKDYIF